MIGWSIASAVQSRGGIWKLVVTYISAALLHCSWNAASVFVGVGNVINPPTQELFSANWVSTAAFVALGVLMLLHFLILTVFNRKLRPARPAYPLYPPAEDQTLARLHWPLLLKRRLSSLPQAPLIPPRQKRSLRPSGTPFRGAGQSG